MSEEKSPEFAEYQQLVSQEKYKKLLDSLPEANVFAGLVVEGNLRVKQRLASTNGVASIKEKPVTPAVASSAAPPRASSGDVARIQKQVNQAKKTFEQTGSIQSLARLRELQAKAS